MIRLYIIVSIFFLFGCNGNTKQESSTINEIKLQDLEGNPLNLEEFKGKVVFLNFWATWCGPCVREMPSIESLQENFKGQPIVFLFASSESKDLIKEFKEKRPFSFEYVQLDMSLEELNIYSLPTTYIYNKLGKLVINETGARMWDGEKSLTEIENIMNSDEI